MSYLAKSLSRISYEIATDGPRSVHQPTESAGRRVQEPPEVSIQLRRMMVAAEARRGLNGEIGLGQQHGDVQNSNRLEMAKKAATGDGLQPVAQVGFADLHARRENPKLQRWPRVVREHVIECPRTVVRSWCSCISRRRA